MSNLGNLRLMKLKQYNKCETSIYFCNMLETKQLLKL